jgi:hypothetical protein
MDLHAKIETTMALSEEAWEKLKILTAIWPARSQAAIVDYLLMQATVAQFPIAWLEEACLEELGAQISTEHDGIRHFLSQLAQKLEERAQLSLLINDDGEPR